MLARQQPVDLTRLLGHWDGGDDQAFSELMTLVFDELRILARAQLRKERPNHTLRTDCLVSEAFIRLKGGGLSFNSRVHFFGIASNAMRQILVDYAREQATVKRGGRHDRIHLADMDNLANEQDADILQLNAALEELAVADARKANIVVMRYFGGLTIDEVAHLLNASTATIKREWNLARYRLRRIIEGMPRNIA